jgi:hypothetical protein
MEVSGTVTLEGSPLNDGRVIFIPLDKQGSESGSPITNGEYKVPKDRGLLPGKYRVCITAGDGKTLANEDLAAQPGGNTNIVSFDRVPEDWSEKSTQEVEVKAGEQNKFDFRIPKARVPKRR